MRRIGSGLFGIVMALALTACGTLERPTGPLRIADGTLIKAQDPRIQSNDSARLQEFTQEIAGRLLPDHPTTILALSGGQREFAWRVIPGLVLVAAAAWLGAFLQAAIAG